MTKTVKIKSIYQQVKALALPLVSHYREDVTKHDRDWLTANARGENMPFLHFTRDMGSHIVPLPSARSKHYPPIGERVPFLFGTVDRYQLAEKATEGAEAYAGSHELKLVLYYDGKTLRKIDGAKAIQIAKDYTARILHTFRHPAAVA